MGRASPSAATPLLRGYAQEELPGNDEEDPNLHVATVQGYIRSWWRTILFVIFNVITLGIPLLILRWMPRALVRMTHRQCGLQKAKCVLITRVDDSCEVVSVQAQHDARSSYDYTQMGRVTDVVTFQYRCLTFIYDFTRQHFARLKFPINMTNEEVHESLGKGHTVEERSKFQRKFGENSISVPVPHPLRLLVNEVLHPFYLFQIFSVIVWMADEYWVYGTTILVTSCISAILNVVQIRKNMKKLKKMADLNVPVTILCDGKTLTTNSRDIVPGDIVEVYDDMILPCDMVLLSGHCIVNESMLTGESVPIVKSHLPQTSHSSERYNPEKDSKYSLYCGTSVVQSRGSRQHPKPLALAIKTGYDTAKGMMVRSMLHPRATKLNFYRDSFKFLAVLFSIALVGFAYSTYVFVGFGAGLRAIALRSLDLITIVVPPALPIALTIGVVSATKRLKHSKIYCISPQRVNEAGKIRLMCFDKTGTLTTDSLDVSGVHESVGGVFSAFSNSAETISLPLLQALGTCHSLSQVNGKLIGEPLELKMFNYITAELTETHDSDILADITFSGKNELKVMERFHFSSALQRMSVVVEDPKHNKQLFFVKGSPEMVRGLCSPRSVPPDFGPVLQAYTMAGCRVLAFACSSYDLPVQKMKRETMENDMTFLGFLIMVNPVKPESGPAIKALTAANIRNVMITGDNVQTAVSVAKTCGILSPDSKIFIGDCGPEIKHMNDIKWVLCDDESITLEASILELRQVPQDDHKVKLAVTGRVFDLMLKTDSHLQNKILLKGFVFARMTPDQKAKLVELYESLEFCVGFCGDGANDCGALKAARVGLSLSEAEASIAAPFTSKIQNISPVITLIREGRCALSTSFQLFKYMALYSLVQFTSVLVMYRIGTRLGDWQFLYIDMFLILPLAFGMSTVGAYRVLVKEKPTANLIHRSVLISVIGQVLIQVIGQIVIYALLVHQPWFVPIQLDPGAFDGHPVPCLENTTIFLFANFQYIFIVLAFCNNKPFREAFYTNKTLTGSLLALIAFSVYITIAPCSFLKGIWELQDLNLDWKMTIIVVAMVDGLVSWAFERYGVKFLSKMRLGRKAGRKLHKQLQVYY